MKDLILNEIRNARAEVAAECDFDLHNFFAWAKAHAEAEKKAGHWLPANPVKSLKTSALASRSFGGRKGHER